VKITTAGVYRMTAEEYHADPCPEPSLSSSLAKILLNQSPLHAWTASPRLNPNWEPVERKTFDIGRAAHSAILGRGGAYLAYPPEMLASNGAASTKEAKAWADAVRANGDTPLKADEVDAIGAMVDTARARLAAMGIKLDPARSELVAVAQIDGIWCRAMLDNVPADPRLPIYDYKTCEDASPDAVRRACENYGYAVQAAHYRQVWEAATGENRGFIFAFQEKAAPHELAVARLLDSAGHSEDWGQDASEALAQARATWRDCLASGVWHGYPAQMIEIGASPYYRAKVQDRTYRAQISKPSPATVAAARNFQTPEGFIGAAE